MSYEKEQKTQSPLEVRFYEDCRTVGLIVEPQYPIGPIHCDFAIVDRKIAIECDSAEWHTEVEARKNDNERDQIYKHYDWKVLRLTGKAILKGGEDLAQLIKNGEFDEYSWTYVHDYQRFDDIHYPQSISY